jgi:predicted PurR-regulated permease PerM
MFNYRIRQVILLLAIALLSTVIFFELYVFVPGFLGAVTLYVLGRDRYQFFTEQKGWNKNGTAILFLLTFLICIGLPIYLAIHLLSSKISYLLNNSEAVMHALQSVSQWILEKTGNDLLSSENIKQIQKQIANLIPALLNNTASVLGNLIMLLFLSFFMFTGWSKMENALGSLIPLKDKSIDTLAGETKSMVKANAIGIPLISIIQGFCAMLGYWIFGVGDVFLWGFLTGLFAFFPILGTMVIWVPLVIYLFSTGNTTSGIGLLLYSGVITGNIDYLARISLLKKIGNVHPLITVLGLIVGLKLFGFWGFIFGPLLISYLLLLIKIYRSEFGTLQYRNENIKGED